MEKITTGEKIGNLAREKQLNLHKLADNAEIPYNTLYSIVKRKSDKVDLETVRKIALVLCVHPIEILGDSSLALIEYGMDLFERGINASREAKDAFLHGNLLETNFDTVYNEQQTTFKKRLLTAYGQLNEEGQFKAVERVEELTEIPKYKQQTPTENKPPERQQSPTDGTRGNEND